MTELPPLEIGLTPEFQRKLKKLAKKYRSLRSDLEPVLEQLQLRKFPGDRIQKIEFSVIKVRIKNSDIKKGKSGGYRLIYWIYSDELIVLLDIYSQSDRTDVETAEIRQIIHRFTESSND